MRVKVTNHANFEDALQRPWCAYITLWTASRLKGIFFTSWIDGARAHVERRYWRLTPTHLERLSCRDAHVLSPCSARVTKAQHGKPASNTTEMGRLGVPTGNAQDIQAWISCYESSLPEIEVNEIFLIREHPFDRRSLSRSCERPPYYPGASEIRQNT